jgi:Tfp pilus assembly protein PilF
LTTAPLAAAVELHRAGRLEAAEAAYRARLAVAPDDAEALNLLGFLCHQRGEATAAAAAIDRALALDPNLVEAWNNRGILRHAARDPAGAAAAYREALARHPGHVEAAHNMALALADLGDPDGAVAALEPALATAGELAVLWLTLGNMHHAARRGAEAMAAWQAALERDPDLPIAHTNIGVALAAEGLRGAAAARFDRALALDPDYADARWNRARLDLGDCRWVRGWADFEARRRIASFARDLPTPPGKPWRGQGDISDRVLLLHAEQGRGDSIQFARWIAPAARRARQTVVEVEADLINLFRSLDAPVTLVARGAPRPPIDVECPLPSLPLALGAVAPDPQGVPYLAADPARRARMRGLIGPADGRLAIGLTWAGNPEFLEDWARSPRLAPLAPLFATPGVRWVLLQKGDGRRDLAHVTPPPDAIDLGPELRDFADTAAAIAELDLVISSCTSPAHVAGALGRPLWMLLSRMADWRWPGDGSTGPWYPTARLFRQPRLGDWPAVVAAVQAALAEATEVR